GFSQVSRDLLLDHAADHEDLHLDLDASDAAALLRAFFLAPDLAFRPNLIGHRAGRDLEFVAAGLAIVRALFDVAHAIADDLLRRAGQSRERRFDPDATADDVPFFLLFEELELRKLQDLAVEPLVELFREDALLPVRRAGAVEIVLERQIHFRR